MGFFRWVFLGFFGWVFLGGFFNANPGPITGWALYKFFRKSQREQLKVRRGKNRKPPTWTNEVCTPLLPMLLEDKASKENHQQHTSVEQIYS